MLFLIICFNNSYRLQRAYDQDILRISPFVKNTVIHTKIVAAIEMHRRVLKLVYTQFEAADKLFTFCSTINIYLCLRSQQIMQKKFYFVSKKSYIAVF